MRRRSLALLVATVSAGSMQSVAPAATLERKVVGQISEIQPPGSQSVWVKSPASAPHVGRPYDPLYQGDQIYVSSAKVSARLLVQGKPAEGVVITKSSGAFAVAAAPSQGISQKTFQALVQSWGFVFAPPTTPQVVTTTPRSAAFTFSTYLSGAPQTVRSGESQVFFVVWHGPGARIIFQDGAGQELARAIPDGDNTAHLSCPPLSPGAYRLLIGTLVIPVLAIPGKRPDGDPMTLAADAADLLRHRETAQMQALADLEALASKTYVAASILKEVERAP